MKRFLTALICLVLILGCINFPLVSHADAYVYTINGERCVFLSNSTTVTYEGAEYSTYASLNLALSALGSQGGKAIICGAFVPSDNGDDGAFKDPAGRGHVTFTGATGAATDSLTQNGTLDFKSGNVTFDDFTLKMGTTKYFAAPGGVFTSNFKVDTSKGALFYTGALSGTFSTLATEISGGTYGQMNLAGMGSVTVGSQNAPGNVRITINGGIINCKLNMGSGYSNSTVYGNTYYVVNGGTFNTKNVVASKMNHPSGRKIAIFNNGMAEGFTFDAGIAVINVPSGGKAVIDDATASNVNPRIFLVPDGETFPVVNGEVPAQDENGKYYLTVDGSASTYDIAWEAESEGVYVVDNIRTVFLSNSSPVTYKETQYTAYDSINTALELIGKRGGRILVNGAFVPVEFSDLNAGDAVLDTIFKDVDRGTVTITGVTGASVDSFGVGGFVNFNACKVIFDDITIKMLKTKYFASQNLVFTENVKVSGQTLLFSGAKSGNHSKVEVVLKGGTFHQLNILGVDSSALGNASELGYGIITVDGASINNVFNYGSGYSQSNINANLYFVINSGSFSNKTVAANKINHVSGRKFAIFNNGTYEGFTVVDGATVINSAAGGTVTVAEGTHALTCPTLVLTPQSGRAPAVNGVEIEMSDDGVYTFKPEQTTTYNVTWISTAPQKYVVDGQNTVFLSDTNTTVYYNGGKYYAFSDITEAVAALGTDGGKLIVSDTYTHTVFSDVKNRGTLTVIGADKESKIVITEQSDSTFIFNGGKTVFDDIEVYVASGAGRYIHGGGDTTFTENFRSNSALYLSPVYSVSPQSAEMYVYAGNYATIDANGSNATVGSPEKPGHIAIHLEGGSFYRVNGGWGWAAKNLYGNLFVYVNKAFVNNDISYTAGATVTGTKNIIFNNKRYIIGGGTEINVASAFDHVIFSDNGGTVTVENEDTTTTPVFILTPDEGCIPFVNGIQLEPQGGVYKFTPQEKGKVYVTWRYPVTVTFDAAGGTGTVPSPINGFSSGTYDLPNNPDISKEGCIFNGWHTDPNAEKGFYSMTFTGNIKLYAIWLEKLPVNSENANFAANGVENAYFDHLAPESASISAAVADAKNDAEFMNTSECVYAFSLTADDGNDAVSDFPHGINFEIPSYAYSHNLLPGEFLRLYRSLGDKCEYVSDLTEADGKIPFTAYSDGKYFVMLNKADTAEYIYSVYEKDSKVYVDLYIYGAVAHAGFFGLKYDHNAIAFDSFNFADGISSAGMSVQDGGYGCFKNADGIYADAYVCVESTDARNNRVRIGTVAFTKLSDAPYGFAFADACEYGANKASGYPSGAEGAYIPYIESNKTVMQPATYTVEQKYVAYIGNTGYNSLEEALGNAADGTTVILALKANLAKDVTLNSNLTLYVEASAEISGGRIFMESGSKVVSQKQIYGSLAAEKYVGMLCEDGLFHYVESAFDKSVLSLYGVQIRTQGVQGLRFVADFVGNKEGTYSDYGIIILPTDLSEHENTTHYTEQIAQVSKRELGDQFKYFEEYETGFKCTACVINIKISNYVRDFTARPYIRYLDGDKEYTVYTDYDAKFDLSVLDVATGLIADGDKDSEALQKIVDEYNEYIGK